MSPPPSSVLFLTRRDSSHPEGGGSELYVEKAAAGLAERGSVVTLFCAAHPGAAPQQIVDGVRVVRRGGHLSVFLHAFLWHATGRLGPHDVVVDVQNGLPFFARLWCRRPVVVLVHHAHREQWQVVFGRLLGRLGWLLESRLAPYVHRGSRYVAVSATTRRELVEQGVAADAITVVHNGADVPVRPAAAKSPHPSICVLGRLVPHKRVELALAAAARIRRLFPDLRLQVLGRGYWEGELRATVERLGLGDTVEFLGFVDEATKHRALAQAWVLAMPSLKEGWGLAVVEAAGHETPTVAFRSAGGVADSVVNGETGLLVDDADQFASQLERLLRRPELRRSLGRAARAHASRFTWAASAAAFTAALEAAVAADARSDAVPRRARPVPRYLGAMRRAASRRTTSPLR
jgi:glycosyltransferase involved in cell wall biosynthesis